MEGLFFLGFLVGGITIAAFGVAGLFFWSVRNISALLKDEKTASIRAGLLVTTVSAVIMPIAVILLFIMMFRLPTVSVFDFVGYALIVIFLLSLTATLGLQPSRKPVKEIESD